MKKLDRLFRLRHCLRHVDHICIHQTAGTLRKLYLPARRIILNGAALHIEEFYRPMPVPRHRTLHIAVKLRP